jgi:hypothetical protein
MAAVWALGKVDASPLSQPLNGAGGLPGGRIGRLAQQVSALAQGACLTPMGEEAHMPQALEAVGHDMQQKTSDKFRGCQRHGLHAIALAPIAIREVHMAIAHFQEAMIGHRNPVDIAAQVLEYLDGSSARALGVNHPWLPIELVEQVSEAWGGAAPGSLLRKVQRLFGVGLLEGCEELGAEDRAQGPYREEKARIGGHPMGPVLDQRTSGYQAVEVEVGIECLIPGV